MGYQWFDLRGYDPEKYPGGSYFYAGSNGDIARYAELISCRNKVSIAAVTYDERIAKMAKKIKNTLRKMS